MCGASDTVFSKKPVLKINSEISTSYDLENQRKLQIDINRNRLILWLTLKYFPYRVGIQIITIHFRFKQYRHNSQGHFVNAQNGLETMFIV